MLQIINVNANSNPEGNNDMAIPQPQGMFQRMNPKKLEDVTCYKCGTKGHYANRCPKGHLAFLSQARNSEAEKHDDASKTSF